MCVCVRGGVRGRDHQETACENFLLCEASITGVNRECDLISVVFMDSF